MCEWNKIFSAPANLVPFSIQPRISSTFNNISSKQYGWKILNLLRWMFYCFVELEIIRCMCASLLYEEWSTYESSSLIARAPDQAKRTQNAMSHSVFPIGFLYTVYFFIRIVNDVETEKYESNWDRFIYKFEMDAFLLNCLRQTMWLSYPVLRFHSLRLE